MLKSSTLIFSTFWNFWIMLSYYQFRIASIFFQNITKRKEKRHLELIWCKFRIFLHIRFNQFSCTWCMSKYLSLPFNFSFHQSYNQKLSVCMSYTNLWLIKKKQKHATHQRILFFCIWISFMDARKKIAAFWLLAYSLSLSHTHSLSLFLFRSFSFFIFSSVHICHIFFR
jgi:hypothetical protein